MRPLEPEPWIEVDLDAIASNVRRLRRKAGVPLLAVVKCDGYGHGLVPSAEAALAGGAEGVAVRGMAEARGLRSAGVRGRIVNLFPHHPVEPAEVREAVRLGIEATVEDERDVEVYSRAAVLERREARLHLKVDTGLGRHGAQVPDAPSLIHRIEATPRVRLVSAFTTLAERGPAEDRRQLRRLLALERVAHAAGARLCAATTGSLGLGEALLDGIRPGLAIFGVGPERPLRGTTPALSLQSPALAWSIAARSGFLGYGRLHRAAPGAMVALLGIGSSDGLPRSLSGRGEVILLGERRPMAGRVSLNHCFVDAAGHSSPPVEPPTATLIGAEGRCRIRVEDVARAAGTSPYEILVRLSPRLERRYFKRGRLVRVRKVRDEYRVPRKS